MIVADRMRMSMSTDTKVGGKGGEIRVCGFLTN